MFMAFQGMFFQGVEKINGLMKTNAEFQDLMKEYEGRSLVVKIKNDATYVVNITRPGLILLLSPKNIPNDMFFETTPEVFKRIIIDRKINFIHLALGKIKVKNIGPKELTILKKLLNA